MRTLHAVSGLIVLFASSCMPPPQVAMRPPPPPVAPPTPNSPETWLALDQQSEQALTAAGFTHALPTVHVVAERASGVTVVDVEPARCYRAIASWSFERELILGVSAVRDDGGRSANKYLGGETRGAPPTYGSTFCADRAGKVRISARPRDPKGRASYEYSIAIGWQPETPTAVASRHIAEQHRDAALVAAMDANVARAEADRQATRDDHCRVCHDDYTTCQLARSVLGSSRYDHSCETAFRACARQIGERSYLAGRDAAAVCGPLPR